MSLVIFAIALVAYFFIHSLLADDRAKLFLTEKLVPPKHYRLIYNLLSLVLLAPLVWMFFILKKQTLLDNPWYALPGGMLLIGGGIWVVQALRGYDLKEFTGLGQLNGNPQTAPPPLKTNGLNRFVRHPLYFGTLLMAWGFFILLPVDAALLVAILTTVYLIIGCLLEERKLVQKYGMAYITYRQKVPMLFPFRLRRRKF